MPGVNRPTCNEDWRLATPGVIPKLPAATKGLARFVIRARTLLGRTSS